MLITIIFTLIFLVTINFLLLAFSCNETAKRKKFENKPSILRQAKPTNVQVVNQLAPTGS